MNSVAIIGGGITGLTAAFELKRKGVPVTVYEAGARVGGVIQSFRKDGYLAESGPNTIIETSPRIRQLVEAAGLASRRLDPDPGAEKRFLVRSGRPIAMPASPWEFFKTKLFSPRAKLAVLREPFVSRREDGHEESIAEFVRRRLGREFLDYAIDALVAGIYAGDPEKLSVEQAFPKLCRLEQQYGSLIKGQILGSRARRRSGEISKDRAPKFSFDHGLQVLPDTLAAHLDGSVFLKSAVTRLSRTLSGWTVQYRSAGRELHAEHSAVLYAGTAYDLAKLEIAALEHVNLSVFAGVRHPAVASVVLGFQRADISHPLDGFGMLIPKLEGFKILGTIFSSSLFPHRAPAGHVTLTSYVGGERYPELAELPEHELCELVCRDLHALLGVHGAPTFVQCIRHARAIPQYNLGYQAFRDLISEIEMRAPGLIFAGHYRDGISVGDSIVSGSNASEKIAATVRAVPARPARPPLPAFAAAA